MNNKVSYKDNTGFWWVMHIKGASVTVERLGQLHQYVLNDIPVKVEQKDEYVYLTMPDKTYYQFKFEENHFLVSDIFDENDEPIEEFGAYVFGEDVDYPEEFGSGLVVETNNEYVSIRENGAEIVYWNCEEWITDPEEVVPAMTKAIQLAYTNLDELKRLLDK